MTNPNALAGTPLCRGGAKSDQTDKAARLESLVRIIEAFPREHSCTKLHFLDTGQLLELAADWRRVKRENKRLRFYLNFTSKMSSDKEHIQGYCREVLCQEESDAERRG